MNNATVYRKDGVSDADRLNTTLNTSSFKIHDLSLQQMLSCYANLGSFLKFYSQSNMPDGTWADAFKSDMLTIMAEIGNYNGDVLIDSILSYVSRNKNFDEKKNAKVVNIVFREIVRIDNWIDLLIRSNNTDATIFADFINQLIEGNFACQYKNLLLFVKTLFSHRNTSIPKLRGFWGSVEFPTKVSGNLPSLQIELRNTLYAFYSLIKSIKNAAQIYYVESLKRNDHSPETGLFYTFLELFKEIQEQINTIPQKYVLYYYQNILKFPFRNGTPDKTYVTIKSDISLKEDIVIPEKTEFFANVDNKQISFVSTESANIKNASVLFVLSLYLEKSPYKEPEKSLDYYSSARIADYSKRNEREICYPLFAANDLNNESGEMAMSTDIGFAISSKILYLSEGERNVTFTFVFDNKSESDFCWDKNLKKKLVSMKGGNEDESFKEKFIQIFKSIFFIELTTHNGWYVVEQYLPDFCVSNEENMKNSFTIKFKLSASAPSIVSYDKSIHGGTYSTLFPVCRFSFNNNAEIYPYSIFNSLILTSVYIDVSVKGASDLSLYNQYGKIDSSTQFAPFGAVPAKGDSLIIGHHEIADKHVESLNLHIEWSNVPWQKNGFSDYYHGYSFLFDNNSFKVSLSELQDGRWVGLDNKTQKELLLFVTENQDENTLNGKGRVSPFRNITDIKVHNFREKEVAESNENFEYTNKSKSNFIKITLQSPDCGFGQALYANDIAVSFIKKLAHKNDKLMPNVPYYPVVNKLSIDYHARTRISFLATREPQINFNRISSFYHTYPFGTQRLYPSSDTPVVSFIPILDRSEECDSLSGNIFIGIKGNSISGIMSLFFKFNEDSFVNCDEQIVWSVLSNDIWKTLKYSDIICDSTHGLTTTGIVTLNVPDEVTCNNSIMPDGCYWIRASVKKNAECFGNLCKVEINGVQLVRSEQPDDLKAKTMAIPVNSIIDMVKSFPGIESIYQQCESSGGLNKESPEEYKARISETIRHKQRLMTCIDYEAAILQNFDGLLRVKCFPNAVSSEPNKVYPGNILVCVIPELKTGDSVQYQCPKVPRYVLKDISKFIKKHTTPFVNIEVINPVYEEIQVRFSLMLKNEENTGDTLSMINNKVSEYISPWSNNGNTTCFGWRIFVSEMKQFISDIDNVKLITNFSMLYRTFGQLKKYNLFDSADKNSGKIQSIIKSDIPWSICVPFQNHVIKLLKKQYAIDASITGISEMEIGSIFIVKGKDRYGNAEQENT